LIELDIDPLPPVSDCRGAIAPDSPDVHIRRKGNRLIDFRQSYGDADEAMRELRCGFRYRSSSIAAALTRSNAAASLPISTRSKTG
jgi:hypothetical protein